ncbi:hypothetical protein BDZ90DRAFT_2545 [Jaminaea rosea]|uniref:Uncharacterized protein n=1 Tax=Jaminaea rosea TaxID=1569628 RepID=A0A316UXG7_9BASI|nr:hypothetical protein BDZ90DRAFT_2545 [Jaminaea rosea]PWN29996.1 hypothetical protein BDZ90DRAFT_2545 [Jaminaea rosea]
MALLRIRSFTEARCNGSYCSVLRTNRAVVASSICGRHVLLRRSALDWARVGVVEAALALEPGVEGAGQ